MSPTPGERMQFIDNRGVTDARVNLALEEHLLRSTRGTESYLLLYVNAPAIIIGRNQSTLEEINHEVVERRGVQVVRRISGGGAVYHDLGNLNFSVLTEYTPQRFNRYDEFTRPVIEVLRELGVPAELGGRNDILVAGRKISGNAQFTSRGRMLSHGTLLFDSRLDDVEEALHPKLGTIESKGVKSVRSDVTNIADHLSAPLTLDEFRQRILEKVFGGGGVPTYPLGEADWQATEELVRRKYATWEWNYGESPPFNVQKTRRFAFGEIDLRLDIERGHVAHARLSGDFLSARAIGELERALVGVRYTRADVAAALGALDVRALCAGIEPQHLLELVYG